MTMIKTQGRCGTDITIRIAVIAVLLLASIACVASASTATYTWKFNKYAIGQDATGSAYESSQTTMSDIIKLPDNSYRMYYGATFMPPVSGADTAIKSATSTDGINWTVESGYRLFGYGYTGESNIPSNEALINGPSVVRLSNGTYRMYYQAGSLGITPNDYRVKSAISSDGITWTREGTRIDINYPNGSATEFSLAGQCNVIRFADNDYAIQLSGNYGTTAKQPSDLVIGTSNDGLTFSHFSVLYLNGHDPYVLKLADGSGYRLFYGRLLERQRTAFSTDGKNWPSQDQTTETMLLDSNGNEVNESSTENVADRTAMELPSGEIMLFVNWLGPSWDIALMRQQFATPVANFTGTPTSGTASLTVTFTDSSTNTPTSWSWNFGDNSSVNATVKNPVHTYASAGTYTVALTATNSAGSNVCTKTGYITVTSGVVTPVANFAGTPTSGTAPLTVTFTDGSTNTPTSWSWNFGDSSSVNATVKNPVHTYASAGTYTVALTATNAAGSNIATRTNYITVTSSSTATYTWKFNKYAIGQDATGSAYESYPPMMSDIIKLPDNSYRMYYGVSFIPPVSGANTAIRSATSTDGINWTVELGYRLIGYGYTGESNIPVNEFFINGPSVVRLSNGTYRMYYQAGSNITGIPDYRVKSAISPDGITWTREGTRIDINYPNGSATEFSLAGQCNVIRFADNDYAIQLSGNYGVNSSTHTSDIVIGTSNDGLTFSHFSVLYMEGHDPYVLKLADGSGYRMFYGNLLERQRTAFSTDGKNWPSQSQTTETVLLDSNGNEVTEASAEVVADRTAMELPSGEIMLFVNWIGPSSDIALMRQQFSTPVANFTGTPTSGTAPLTVTFTDSSTNTPTSWSWNFGDRSSVNATVKNPIHTYSSAGTYTVALIATNSAGSNVCTKTNYITVTSTTSESRTGMYRPGDGFYLKSDNGNNPWNSNDRHLTWDNAAGDLPVAGDWNKDGKSKTGVYRPGDGFYLKMDNINNPWNSNDLHLTWDNGANDRPIAGDWNKEGKSKTGVYRPGDGFYLKMDNENTWTSTDLHLTWDNAANDLPIAGDWNKDGMSETGVYRPGDGFYLKMDNINSPWNSNDLHLTWDNAAGDRPIAGDWNADGTSETGVYRPGDGFYLKKVNDNTWTSTDLHLTWDNADGDRPVAGNFV